MKIDNFFAKPIPELLKELGWSPFACFLFISLVATLVAFSVIGKVNPNIDTNDPGVILIIAVTGVLVYGAIWIFVKQVTTLDHS